jgi:predicted RNA-binding protein
MGVPKRRKKIIDQVKPGDLLVFYVKPKRIGGVLKATSESFESDEEIFAPVKGEIFHVELS